MATIPDDAFLLWNAQCRAVTQDALARCRQLQTQCHAAGRGVTLAELAYQQQLLSPEAVADLQARFTSTTAPAQPTAATPPAQPKPAASEPPAQPQPAAPPAQPQPAAPEPPAQPPPSAETDPEGPVAPRPRRKARLGKSSSQRLRARRASGSGRQPGRASRRVQRNSQPPAYLVPALVLGLGGLLLVGFLAASGDGPAQAAAQPPTAVASQAQRPTPARSSVAGSPVSRPSPPPVSSRPSARPSPALASPPPTEAERPSAGGIAQPWPPVEGERYPDLELTDLEGRPFRLSSLAGKVIVLQLVGTRSPASIAFCDGDVKGPFQGQSPQPGIPGWESILGQIAVSPDNPELVRVDVLFYRSVIMGDAPSLEDARAWAKHFGLEGRENVHVLLGDARYLSPETKPMIPGMHLLDREFVLRCDAGGGANGDKLFQNLFPLVRDWLAEPAQAPPKIEVDDPFPPAPVEPRGGIGQQIGAQLVAREYDQAEATLDRVMQEARDRFGATPPEALTHMGKQLGSVDAFERWKQDRPESYMAWKLRGDIHIEQAWTARGSGWANTVSEEGRRVFLEQLELARVTLEHAHQLDPSRPEAAASLITVAMGSGQPRERADHWLEQAVKAAPRYGPAFDAMLTYLMPKWHGSRESLLEFAHGMTKRFPDDAGMHMLVVNAYFELAQRSGDKRAYVQRATVRRVLERAFEPLLAAYPDEKRVVSKRVTFANWLRDPEDSARWLRRGAELGDLDHMRDYGYVLERGDGVPADPVAAFEWYLKAGRAGSITACADLAQYFYQGEVVAHNGEAAMAWARRGSEGGSPYSMNWLADCYRFGVGTEVNLAEAARWYSEAAAGGLRSAGEDLRKLLTEHPELRRR